MKWSSAVSCDERLDCALAEAAQAVRRDLGEIPDLTFIFPSEQHAEEYSRVPELLAPHLEGGVLIGCSAGGVIGRGHEVEGRHAVTVTSAVLPGVTVHPFHIEQDDLPDPDSSPRAWHDLLGAPNNNVHFVILADPFSVAADQLLVGLDYAYPKSKKVGGLASGANRPGANALYMGGRVWGVGAVGVALSGNIAVDTVVAQGCRPIGKPACVTACEENLLTQLDGKPPVEVLRGIYESLSARDQSLARNSLHLGVATSELNEAAGPGDFLIRNFIGIDPKKGFLAVGESLREGQTVQFHLRDARTSAEDLDELLRQYIATSDHLNAAGALLFSCQGRGTHLYGRPDHDTELFNERLGGIPLGGFFCSGEIGPVGTSTYLHGFTSAFCIFKPRDDSDTGPRGEPSES